MTLKNTVEWFSRAIPEPSKQSISVQLGCHIEEFCELLECATLTESADEMLTRAFEGLIDVAALLKSGAATIESWSSKIEVLDALADSIVTAAGLAYMHDMDIDGALAEVNRSNFSKFENGKPVFHSGGKIGKGKYYTPPGLDPFTVVSKID